jgi:hypothetical protein
VQSLINLAQTVLKQKLYLSALVFAVAAVTFMSPCEASAAAVLSPPSFATPSVNLGPDVYALLRKVASKALGSGKAGASAAIVQILSLQWLHTAMTYQLRYGGNLTSALHSLMNDGGIPRLYQGWKFAMLRVPLSKFGDTFANVGVLALLNSLPAAAGLPLPIKTAAASVTSGLWRFLCMPAGTVQTVLQVQGTAGFKQLKQDMREQGMRPLFRGTVASTLSGFASNYPWFLTYNALDQFLPLASNEQAVLTLLRSALLGVSASCVSDTLSNSLRVVKTMQQTPPLRGGENRSEGGDVSFGEALRDVLETDGIKGLFGRGLKTRLMTNTIQDASFSVLWKYFQTTAAAR